MHKCPDCGMTDHDADEITCDECGVPLILDEGYETERVVRVIEIINRAEDRIRRLLADAELQAAKNETLANKACERCRIAAQVLIAEIGASGPEDVTATAERAVGVIRKLRAALHPPSSVNTSKP